MAKTTLLTKVTNMQYTHHFHAPARLLMAALFVWSGVGKLGNVEYVQGYMEAYGVPGYLIWPAAAFEIGSGVMLMLGLYTRQCAMLMAGWCALTALIFHIDFKDPTQEIMFLKNATMAGGFLILSDHGAPGLSLSKKTSKTAVDEQRKIDSISEKRYGTI